MSSEGTTREIEARANDLYWNSDLGVNQIAEELDLSKGTLYGLIAPLPADAACPECGEAVVFANRTARDRAVVSCPVCEWEGRLEDARPLQAGAPGPGDEADSPVRLAWLDDSRARTLVGGAFLGAAAGLALVFWARRR
ncbi:MAG: hypothetical protein ACE5GJ_12850 [Gemmatimonadota bacterium]